MDDLSRAHALKSAQLSHTTTVVAVDVLPDAKRALATCGHPAELCALATSDGLLNAIPEKRVTLGRVLERYPVVVDSDDELNDSSESLSRDDNR